MHWAEFRKVRNGFPHMKPHRICFLSSSEVQGHMQNNFAQGNLFKSQDLRLLCVQEQLCHDNVVIRHIGKGLTCS